jgi:hypothetical protein
MPEEPLQDLGGMDYNAYLAEVRSIGGLSGSPVFVYVPPDRFKNDSPGELKKGAAFLLGVIREHWDLTSKESALDFAEDFDAKINMGIAAVTPIQEVIDIVNNKELLSRRRKAELDYIRSHAPTKDSDLDKPIGEAAFTKVDFETALKKVSRKLPSEKLRHVKPAKP